MKVKYFIIALLLLTACKPEEEHCWQCDFTYSGGKPERTGDTVLCNYTQTDIELREDIEFSASGTGYDKWKLTNCQQQ